MRMDPSNKDIKVLLDTVITRIEKNEKENKRISDALIVVKEELKDINSELDTIITEVIGSVPELDEIEKKHLTVLNTLNTLTKDKSTDDEEEFDIEFLDTIVGES
tara:strand:+ start:641 stop:955 length:315 start_codon:yes stop_codon:yes gene_type:complete